MLTLEGDLRVYERADFADSGFSVPDLSGRVLLAEDGADNQRLMSAYLKQAGLEVTVVGNGREAALERFHVLRPQITLLDIGRIVPMRAWRARPRRCPPGADPSPGV